MNNNNNNNGNGNQTRGNGLENLMNSKETDLNIDLVGSERVMVKIFDINSIIPEFDAWIIKDIDYRTSKDPQKNPIYDNSILGSTIFLESIASSDLRDFKINIFTGENFDLKTTKNTSMNKSTNRIEERSLDDYIHISKKYVATLLSHDDEINVTFQKYMIDHVEGMYKSLVQRDLLKKDILNYTGIFKSKSFASSAVNVLTSTLNGLFAYVMYENVILSVVASTITAVALNYFDRKNIVRMKDEGLAYIPGTKQFESRIFSKLDSDMKTIIDQRNALTNESKKAQTQNGSDTKSDYSNTHPNIQ